MVNGNNLRIQRRVSNRDAIQLIYHFNRIALASRISSPGSTGTQETRKRFDGIDVSMRILPFHSSFQLPGWLLYFLDWFSCAVCARDHSNRWFNQFHSSYFCLILSIHPPTLRHHNILSVRRFHCVLWAACTESRLTVVPFAKHVQYEWILINIMWREKERKCHAQPEPSERSAQCAHFQEISFHKLHFWIQEIWILHSATATQSFNIVTYYHLPQNAPAATTTTTTTFLFIFFRKLSSHSISLLLLLCDRHSNDIAV